MASLSMTPFVMDYYYKLYNFNHMYLVVAVASP